MGHASGLLATAQRFAASSAALVWPPMQPRQVPFVALDRQHAALRDELRAAFDRIVSSSGFILGEEVTRFEHEYADYCGVRHCIGVGSGTAALTLALEAMGMGRGHEVIVPAHTFAASALAVLHAGAVPVFCDVEEGTGLIDVEAAEDAVSSRTAAILPVHLYGQACDMDAISALATRHSLAILEDAAQAHGATYRGRRVGALGTAAAFSFYPSKNLGALGDGGAICTDDEELAQRSRALRDLGRTRKDLHQVAGYNERLDALQAAFLRVKLPHLDTWNEARRGHAAAYDELLEGRVELLTQRPESPSIYHLFPIRVANRDEVADALAGAGIQTGIHYSPIVPEHPPFAGSDGEFPHARRWAASELSLPIFGDLTREEIERTVSALLERGGPLQPL
jgi:dTDP-4-amino-4,6-dideoxygalactose transaminase